MCGGPTGPVGRGGPSQGGASPAPQHARADVSGWVRVPLLGYPVTPAVAALAAALVGSAVALALAVRLRARPRPAAPPT